MFEITGDDVSLLGDADLRTLIGLLCEADLRRRELPTSAATWGGDQTAKDGGLDVRVSLPTETSITGFIPNPQTGFQVKTPDMPKGKILEEMKPGGVLRPVIIELANAAGAYVIVSSTGSTSDTALKSRRDAMLEALKGSPAEGKLAIDFYDRNRVATWVRDCAGLIPWVRSRIGKAVPGWQAFGPWSLPPAGTDASFLTDEHARIRTGERDDGDGVSVIEGLNRIRKVLRNPGHVVRLVGLSGVGKTRFAEALFEATLGEGALDSSLAIYTNLADQPNPPPTGLCSDLVAGQTPAIVVVDNCPPELHRHLSEVARSQSSTISVMTIEYDIREDQPEGTDVFALDVSSIALIEKIVGRRYPNLSDIDVRTIAEFSGGNARIGLALASRIEKTETVAGLGEEVLFKRLFQQRHDPDPTLLLIAQACSLVYSFDGEKLDGDDAELSLLGNLIGKTADEMHYGIVALKQRDLLQSRAQWRAVLPHAIAIRLAKMALQTIPAARIQTWLDNAPERLLRSFSRRLGYLDDSKEAQAVVSAWLLPGGLLDDTTNLNELGRQMFTNIAPVAPEAVLSQLERVLSAADEDAIRGSTYLVRLLRSLAYDSALFERAVALLAKFAALSTDGKPHDEATSAVESLFHIVLSGTHAPIDMRVRVADGFLRSSDKTTRALGIKALQALMKTHHFTSMYEFDFGARSRNYGFFPRKHDDVREWFGAVLELASKFALSQTPATNEVRRTIAAEFRDLFRDSGRAEELDCLVRAAAPQAFWPEGWIAVRKTLIYDGKGLVPDLRERLMALEEFMRPKDLESQVRGLVMGGRGGVLDLSDLDDEEEGGPSVIDYESKAARSTSIVVGLGQQVASNETVLRALLADLVVSDDPRVVTFGEALAETAHDPSAMWDAIVAKFSETKTNLGLLIGFLKGLQRRDGDLADTVLDEALEGEAIGPWFPMLQARGTMDVRARARLHRALALGKANIRTFYGLAYGDVCGDIPGQAFRDLAVAIARAPDDGWQVALRIVSMRLFSDRTKKREPQAEVLEAGRMVLEEFRFHRKDVDSSEDHDLAGIVRASLAGSSGTVGAQRLCDKLLAAAARHEVRIQGYHGLMRSLLEVHPSEILDVLFPSSAKARSDGVRLIRNFRLFRETVLDAVSDETLLAWCDLDPTVRYPLAGATATLFRRPAEGKPHEWTPLTARLLENAPDPRLVLDEIVVRLYPTSWSGSLATKLEGRLKLLDALPGGESAALADALAKAKSELQASINAERGREIAEDRASNNRFE